MAVLVCLYVSTVVAVGLFIVGMCMAMWNQITNSNRYGRTGPTCKLSDCPKPGGECTAKGAMMILGFPVYIVYHYAVIWVGIYLLEFYVYPNYDSYQLYIAACLAGPIVLVPVLALYLFYMAVSR